MKDFQHTLIYSIVLGVVCAAALTATSRLTDKRYEANKKAYKDKEVMKVLGITDKAEYDSKVIKGRLNKHDTYKYGPLTAIEFEGPGLWGPVKGLLCLEKDMRTIYAVSFYEQEETPGLGGEISGDEFRSGFRGKTIISTAGQAGIRVSKGKGAGGLNEVDGISGATMTCDKVQRMLNLLIEDLIEELNKDGE